MHADVPSVTVVVATSTAPVLLKPKIPYDLEVLNAIESCESQFDPTAKNASSTASGAMQFLHGTWVHYSLLHWGTLQGHSVWSEKDSRALALWIIDTYGTNDWLASKSCWSKLI